MNATLQQRRRQLALTSGSGLALLAALLVLLNVLANWVFFRADLTQRHAYSLSDSSKKLVKDIDDRVVIKAYFTPDLPSPYNGFARYVQDLLTEYRAASRGHVRFEFVLTSPREDFEKKAAEAGLMPIQFQQASNDQLDVRRGYMGLVLYYGSKTETIPVVKGVETLEYELTSKLARMIQRKKKIIAFTAGHGELQWRGPQSKLAEDLSELYDFREISLVAASTAPIQADALFIVGPHQKLDDKSLWAIDQAIMHGIPTAFLVDTKNVAIRQFMASPTDTGLAPLLENYSVKIEDRLVLDAQCEVVNMMQNIQGFSLNTSLPYPYILSATYFSKDNPVVRDLDSIGIPFVTRLDPLGKPGIHFEPVIFSSARSWMAPQGGYRISPDSVQRPGPGEPQGPFILAAMLDGSFPSYFQGKPSPFPGAAFVGNSPKTQIFVLGTSHVLDPELPAFPGADGFATNLMAVLSHDETLLGIRSKGEIFRPLKPLSAPERQWVKGICVLGVPILAALWGLWGWRRRQAWRQAVVSEFRPPVATA